MAKCIQNFKSVLNSKKIKKFLNESINQDLLLEKINLDNENNKWTQLSDGISNLIIEISNENKAINSYDFFSLSENLTNTLKLYTSEFENFDQNLDDLVFDIVNKVKSNYVKSFVYDTNPIVDENRIYDFSSIMKLVYNNDSYMNYLNSLINIGLFKVIFINSLDTNNKDYPYEGFVTTDAALNKNIALYKNELWDYIYRYYLNNHPNPIKIKDSNLYILSRISNVEGYDLSLNDALFGNGKNSIYAQVIEFIKEQMDINMQSVEGDFRIISGNRYTIAQAYIKSLLLTNFDSFLLNNHSDKVKVNINSSGTFNLPTNGLPKYSLNIRWGKKSLLDNENANSVEENRTSLIKLIAYTIPFYEQRKTSKGTIWVKNEYGLSIGKNNLDAIGTILNELNNDIKFNIEINGNNELHTISELYDLYDKGVLSFKKILRTVIDQGVEKSNNILARKSVLESIYQFLYAPKGLRNSIFAWRDANKETGDFILNPELALINHLRNTVKNVYHQASVYDDSKTVDVLDLDFTISKEVENLFVNLDNAQTNNIINSNYTVNNFDDFIKLLTDQNKGDLSLSQTTIEEYRKILESKNVDFNSNNFKNAIKYLTSNIKYQSTDNIPTRVATYFANDVDDILHLRDLFKISKRDIKFDTVTQVKKSTGESVPTMVVANMSSLFNNIIDKTDNIFSKNPGFYKRNEVLLEVIGKYGSKDLRDLNANEIFMLSFTKYFLEARLKDNEFINIPVTYSDKSTIYGTVFNTAKNINTPFGLRSLNSISLEELKEVMRVYQSDYYNTLISNIYNDFYILDNDFFKTKPKTSISKINKIEEYLEQFNKLNSKEEILEAISDKIHSSEHVEISEETHYSFYKNENGKDVIKFNQLLKSYVQIFNDKKLFDKWAEYQEKELFKYIPEKISLNYIVFQKKDKKEKIASITNAFPNIKITNDDEIVLKDENNITDIVKTYLWTKNLVTSQYLNISTKDSYIHPYEKLFTPVNNKWDSIESVLTRENNKRTTTMTKRMNIFGASMSIYGKSPEGILQKHKIAVMSDPETTVFNYTGDQTKIEVYNGGALVNPIFNELLKVSLPGYNLQSSQKPIAQIISESFSGLLKFATFAISNNDIRNSNRKDVELYNIMKKLNSEYLWKDGYFDLFSFKDLGDSNSYSPIDLQAIVPNLYLWHNGKMQKFLNIKLLKDNIYTIYFEGGDEKQVEINNLFDLWKAFGGEYSATMENNQIKYDESSINLVASIVSKHAIYNKNNTLKESLITMLVPKSAIKYGATNINTVKDVFFSDKSLNHFIFDTSFFGTQLDPYHTVEDSEVNEITQVISALSEMNLVPELSDAVYDAISTVTERGLEKFNIRLNSDKDFKIITKLFIKRLNNSSQINNARTIVNALENDFEHIIPFDNKTIYKQFISFLISEVNAEFVRRKFPGAGYVLRPSQGFVQLYEDRDGNKYLNTDLIRIYDELSVKPQVNTLDNLHDINNAKIDYVLSTLPSLQPTNINISSIRPLDVISLNIDITLNGNLIPANTPIRLNEINDYFQIKGLIKSLNNSDIIINKIYNQPRDLKPSDVTFVENGIQRSIWDCDAIEFKWRLLNDNTFKTSKMYNDFVKYIQNITGSVNILPYVDKWIQRTFELLSYNKNYISYQETNDNYFNTIFKTVDGFDDFTGKFENNYINTNSITDYKYYAPENIKSYGEYDTFGIKKDTNLNKINISDFLLPKKYLHPLLPVPADLVLVGVNGEDYYVSLEDFNYIEYKNKLYLKTVMELAKRDAENNNTSLDAEIAKYSPIAEEIQIYISDDGNYRIDSFGHKMYKLPASYKMFLDTKGNEILYIKEGIDSFLESHNNLNYIYTKDKGYNTVDKLLDLVDDDYLTLLTTIANSVNNQELESFFRKKIKNYKEFKRDIIDKYNTGQITKKNVIDLYEEFLKTKQKTETFKYSKRLANIKYKSFKQSLKSVVARIPAQALQSVMSMETVGFIPGSANDIYVSIWQLFLQGSDFDIDKVYTMGYSFKNGQFEAWSPYFDTTKFDESINIPLPKNRKYILLNEKNLTKYKDVLITDDNGINFSNDVFNINSFLESNGINDSSFLDKFIAITNELNKNEYKYIYSEDNYLLKAINRHESYYNENGFKNYIVNKMIGVLESPTTQVASNIPVTSGVYGEIKKNYSDSPYNLDVYNGYTMGLQQEQNTVGKAVIGIAAVGLKNYFALVKYFGNYYMNVDNIDVNSSKYFFKHYVINGKEYCFNKIAGLNNYKNIQDKLDEILVQNIRTSLESISKDTILSEYMSNSEYIDYIISSMEKLPLDNDIAFYISAILTLATDNAKELLLAKINAGIEFAGMHIYLLMLGVSPDEVTKFMTSPEAMELKRKTENNIFITNGRPVSRINMIRASIDKNIKALPINEYRSNFFVNFFNIFMDSQELITLGSFLSVNQGSKANEESLYELLNNLRFSLVNQRKMLKRKYFNDLSDLETIKKDKPWLNEVLIEEIYDKAKNINIVEKELDLDLFFNDDNYRKIAIDYYNLIKSTFNILDVLSSLKHFNSMFKSFHTVDTVITSKTNKHYFNSINNSKKIIEKILDIYTQNELYYKITKHIILNGVQNNPVTYSSEILNKINDYYDNWVIYKFFNTLDYKFDLIALMNYLGIDNIRILKDSQDKISVNTFTKKDLENSPIRYFSLNSPYELAKFKYIMEEYIIPFEKKKHANNGFLKRFVKTSYLNYNLNKKISYYLDESNYDELEDLEAGISEMIGRGFSKEWDPASGEYINTDYILNINTVQDGDSKLNAGIKLIDLLTAYNLIINEGRFGGNRATELFYKDADDPNSISRKFLNFESSITHEDVDILVKDLSENNNNLKGFLLYVFGDVDIYDKNKPKKLNVTENETLQMNRYYTFPYEVSHEITVNKQSQNLADEIVQQIKNKKLVISKECK